MIYLTIVYGDGHALSTKNKLCNHFSALRLSETKDVRLFHESAIEVGLKHADVSIWIDRSIDQRRTRSKHMFAPVHSQSQMFFSVFDGGLVVITIIRKPELSYVTWFLLLDWETI